MEQKITFKYHPNLWELDILSKNEDGSLARCQCCENETEYYYDTMYASDDVDCICLECIASGKAAEKFDGDFIQIGEVEKVNDQEKIKELFTRTPGYVSWQGESWLACCNDFCTYLGEVGAKELKELGIAEEVINRYYERQEFPYRDIEKYLVKNGYLCGYLFQCLHCKKYHLNVDAA